MEICIPIAANVAELLVAPILCPLGYVYNYRTNIQNLKEEVQKLTETETSMQHQIAEAVNRGEEIEAKVESWRTRVSSVTEEAGKVFQDEDAAKKKIFMGLCPNLKKRYQLSRKAKKEMQVVVQLKEEGEFDKVGYRAPHQGIVSVKDSEDFDSRTLVLNEILDSLKDSHVNMIGVYGMGGLGKTTLVKKVAVRVKEDEIFEGVVLALVSQSPDLKRIQGEIADGLDIKLDAETVKGRADQLHERIKKKKKILVILDDIWARIELEDMGIPCGSTHNECKILMTSRNQNVLREMNVEKDFGLQFLTDDEAWRLFEKTVGSIDSSLHSVAADVVRKCAGLPLLLVPVARALRNANPHTWKNALTELKSFDEGGQNIGAQVDSALMLSYNSLQSDETKSLFLLCGQHRHVRIPIKDLLRYSMGLGLFRQCKRTEEVRNKLGKLIDDLKASCLLQRGDNEEFVKMHDLVHRFAITKASSDHHFFTIAYDDALKEWPTKDKLEQFTRISLPYCQIPELSTVFDCPNLESFLLLSDKTLTEIPGNFFEGKKNLKVLHMKSVPISPLSISSLKCLVNLKTLCFDGCDLPDISVIGELKELQVLSIRDKNIIQLPKEIGQLARLRVLDLSNCPNLRVILPNVLSRLTQLEELCMDKSFRQWQNEGLGSERNNASLAELKQMSNLVTLHLHIKDPKNLPHDLLFGKLERFRMLVGEEWDWEEKFQTERKLKLQLNGIIALEGGIKSLMEKADDLHLEGLEGFKSILYELDVGGFQLLKRLRVERSDEIQRIIKSPSRRDCVSFPRLESLSLEHLSSLAVICGGPLPAGSFRNLKIIRVSGCGRLKEVFPVSMARGLLHLQEIHVGFCQNLEAVVCEEAGENDPDKIEGINFSQLRALRISGLPSLRSFCCKVQGASVSEGGGKQLAEDASSQETTNGGLLPLFSEKILFPNLKQLILEGIKNQKLWHTHLLPGNSFQNLTNVNVNNCNGLKYLFPLSLVEYLGQLKHLELQYCSAMEEVISVERSREEQEMNKVLLSKLQSLRLYHLPNLTRFCECYLIECPLVKMLTIDDCPRLSTFVSSFAYRSRAISNEGQEKSQDEMAPLFDEKVTFPLLTDLNIQHSNNIEKIWLNQLVADSFCELKRLSIWSCKKLTNVFPPVLLRRFQKLEVLNIGSCQSLEEIFEVKGLNDEGRSRLPISFQLRELSLLSLRKLKHIWSNKDPQAILNFPILQSVTVKYCGMLKNVFPSSIARHLLKLEKLEIQACGVEEMIVKGENDETSPSFMLPNLKVLELKGTEVGKLFGGKMHKESQGDVRIQHLLLQQTFSNLEELSLRGEGVAASLTFLHQFPSNLFSTIKTLHLSGIDQREGIPITFLQKFHNLKEFILYDSELEEVFSYDELATEKDHTPALAPLRHLKINYNDSLRHIWDQHDHMASLLQNIETLYVAYCDGLENLAPPSASFQNLTSLFLKGCHGLSNLITTRTAKSLGQLTHFEVGSCDKVIEIIDRERDKTKDDVIFPKLQSLKLVSLQNLTSFCSGNYTFQFPSLKEVHVEKCPKMKVFSPAMVNTPKLRRVYFAYQEKRWEGNLNTTIQQLYTEMEGLTQSQNSSTPMDFANSNLPQVQSDPRATNKSNTILPPSSPTELATVSNSACPAKAPSSQEATSGFASDPSSETPSLPIREIESLFAGVEQLVNPSETSSPPASNSNPHAEYDNSGFVNYVHLMSALKEVLLKPLTEVARSNDRLLLLSTLKNLRKCHVLNSQQLEAIEGYIENFDSLVTCHSVFEDQIDRTGALKFSIEDKKKGIATLRKRYEDLASKSIALDADKEALKRRLRDIEEEEDHIRVDMRDLHAELVAQKGKLEVEIYDVREFERDQMEAKDKVRSNNDQWANIRSLFS